MSREPRCECGRRRRERDAACTRCLWLDGIHAVDADVIAELEQADSQTPQALAAATGWTRAGVARALYRMERAGRVMRLPESERRGAATPTRWRLLWSWPSEAAA